MGFDQSGRTAWTDAEIAVQYDRARPGYPAEAVEFALEPLRGRPDLRAVDVGAGTGKLTRQLCAAGISTVAVEPAPGMRKLLAHSVSRAQVLAGSAEALPLPDGSADLVAVGQAFHWFDRERALPELARVLRPGGRMALFYNSRDRSVAWVRALDELIGRQTEHADEHRERDLRLMDPFRPEAYGEFRQQQELDAAGLADLVASRSYAIRMPPAERGALLDNVRRLARTHPQLVGRQHFYMPYLTGVQRYLLDR